jgi:hypothetical protein
VSDKEYIMASWNMFVLIHNIIKHEHFMGYTN